MFLINNAMIGYLHPLYAQSFVEFGSPRELPLSKGWILERKIPATAYRDAMGCYPLFVCQDWMQLCADLENINNELVSLAVVTDPFGDYDESHLKVCFKDVVNPFKQHFVVDLSCSLENFVSGHHRRNARKALQELLIEKCTTPLHFLDDWVALYQTLIDRHNIKGITAFSRSSFAKQMEVPGLVVFRAVHQDKTIGMLLWYARGDVAYYHLGAYNSHGYEMQASFALFWRAIEYFKEVGLQWLNLGAGAGVDGNGTDGLSRFKHGWSTGTRTTYFCGRIFDHVKYSEIVTAKKISPTRYFPAYRQGEFA